MVQVFYRYTSSTNVVNFSVTEAGPSAFANIHEVS